MGTRLNEKAYTKLIEENIAELEKYMPKNSLEKMHIIDVLKESIRHHYGATQFRQQPTAEETEKELEETGRRLNALMEKNGGVMEFQSPPQPVLGDREISEACPEDCGPEWIIGAKWMRDKLTKGE